MQVTVKQYSQTLYEATKEKSQSEIDKIVVNFVNILAQEGQLKSQQLIVEKFKEIYNQENKIIQAQVITCEKLDFSLQQYLKKYLSKKYKAQEVVINNKIDRNIQGGVILKIKDECLDGSIKRQLEELKKSLAN